LHPAQSRIPLLIKNGPSIGIDADKPISLVHVTDLIVTMAGLQYPENVPHFRPEIPAVFGHLDNNPATPVGVETGYSIYGSQNWLVVSHNHEEFKKEFHHFRKGNSGLPQLLEHENYLAENIGPFMGLERVFPFTDSRKQLDDKNIEMLKSLGYIEK
jgi:hypothetical protein